MRWVCAIVLSVALLAPTSASAQDLPPPPAEIPSAPEPVPSTISQVLDAAGPPANEAATQLAPIATATGFAFRPLCSMLGTAMVALVLAGAYVPSGIAFTQAVGPALIYCAHTYKLGPLDPVFAQIDAMLAPAYEGLVGPAMTEAHDAAAPVREQLGSGCGYSPLVAAPLGSLPAPVNRIDLVRIVCG